MDLNTGHAITTKHRLDFMMAEWRHPLAPDGHGGVAFMVGTCNGLYNIEKGELNLIAVINDMPGNGHLDDVFEWFEFAAKTQGLDLYIRDFFNPMFKKHCIEKRGFKKSGEFDVVKKWKDIEEK